MTDVEFRAWRTRLGLTQAEAGRRLGLAVRPDGTTCDAVRHYERDTRRVPESVVRLCRYIEFFGALPDEAALPLAKGPTTA